MNGPQDLGGRAGFGPIAPEPGEPTFHAKWEKRALGLTLCAGALGYWRLDEGRHARESLPHTTYLTISYYDIWIRALTALLLQHGAITPQELEQGKAHTPGARQDRRLPADQVQAVLAKGAPVDRPASTEPKFKLGDRVQLSADQDRTHTRRPSYAMGKSGQIIAVRGHHVYADAAALGNHDQAHWLYGVAFDGATLWGAGAEPGTRVVLDAFEPYLTRV